MVYTVTIVLQKEVLKNSPDRVRGFIFLIQARRWLGCNWVRTELNGGPGY
jgi:hypothetical protein